MPLKKAEKKELQAYAHHMAHEKHDVGGKVFVREIIFGFNDGLVTTFAVATGVAGALTQNFIVILVGIISAVAGAISMGLGTYISIKSQTEVFKSELRREVREIDEMPEEETREIREIYAKKGFSGRNLDMVVKTITSDKKIWLKVMMEEELGLGKVDFKSPVSAAVIIFFAFIVGSVIPLVPYIFLPVAAGISISVVAAIMGLFAIGAIKSQFTKRSWAKSGLEMVLVGLVASLAAYYLGTLVSQLAGGVPLV